MNQTNHDTLQELAQRLALNNVNISLWNLITSRKARGANYQNIYKTVLAHPNLQLIHQEGRLLPERNIVIVGAGASFNACNSLKMGKDTAEELSAHFEKKLGNNLLRNEIKRLQEVFRLPDDFETNLYAISRFDPKGLKEELQRRYHCRYQPNLTYEILAHLFKHRFVDVIVNFNFDELLDQAIADELNPNEYQRIISDGEYDESLLFDSEGLRYPVYIKPHGTASHQSSMRFTREDYFSLPAGIEEAIGKIVNQSVKGAFLGEEDNGERTELPVNFIIVGFNMMSLEFNLLLKEHLAKDPRKTRFYFFQRSTQAEFFDTKKDFDADLKARIEQESRWVQVSSNQPLDECFRALWASTCRAYQPNFRPRDVHRHELIALLFQSHKKRETPGELYSPSTHAYLHNRMLIELALSIVKYKGFVCVEQLVSDRFGKYYNLLQQFLKKANSPQKGEMPTIPEYCALFGLKKYNYGETAFYLAKSDADELDDVLTKSPAEIREIYFKHICKVLETHMKDDESVRRFLAEMKKEADGNKFWLTVKELSEEGDSEISPVYDNLYQNIFRDPRTIKTQLGFKYYTHYYLEGKAKRFQYDEALIIAETGEWYFDLSKKYESLLKGKKFKLIVADQKKKPNETFDNIKIKNLKWWLHNQHMTVLLRHEKGKLKPVVALYFTRRQRSSHINPVVIGDKHDLKILVEIFEAYWLKADRDDQDKVDKHQIKEVLEQQYALPPEAEQL
jgi:hypothetical protein